MQRKLAASVAPLAGMALQAWVVLGKADGGFSAFLAGWFVFACLPYFACLVALWKMRSVLPGVVGAVLALAWDANMYYAVFVAPSSSTAAIALLFSPAVALAAAALGAGATWLVQRQRSREPR